MADRPLTCKQEFFVQGLFARLSQREAYKQAYNTEKMKDATIDRNAHELANNNKIAARLAELVNEFKERNMVTVEKILAEYQKVGFADIKDFLEFGTVKVIEDHDSVGNPIYGYRQEVEARPSSEVDGTLINEVSISKDGTFKFKLHDKMAALEKMGKHLSMFVEKHELTGPNGGPIQTQNMSDEELDAKIAHLVGRVIPRGS